MKARLFQSILLSALLPATSWADITRTVSSFEELSSAIEAVSRNLDGTFTIQFGADITAPTSDGSLQQFIILYAGTNLVIEGNGHTLDMGGQDRAFYVAAGEVSFSNLTIANGYAKGGDGTLGGGGGMGAGAAIHVANGRNLNPIRPETSVTISNVSFLNNTAAGGGGGVTTASSKRGGGGGMGGDGGAGYFNNGVIFHSNIAGYGGGGGLGIGSDGGSSVDYEVTTPGMDGIYNGGASGGAGVEHLTHSEGGEDGGGGGASWDTQWSGVPEAGGGGGGVGGADGTTAGGGVGGYGGGGGAGMPKGGHGGYGGGGGGATIFHTVSEGGAGGFGGGGGLGYTSEPGSSSIARALGSGGFGGGNAVSDSSSEVHSGAGGGGMGAGGAIFIEKGVSVTISGGTSFADNTVIGGSGHSSGAGAGSGIGANVFLGSDLTYHVASGSVSIEGLGGGGDASDPNVAGRDTNGNAQGGLVKTGTGNLRLAGSHTYAGATRIEEGVVTLATTDIFTRGYEVLSGGTLVLSVGNDTPAAIDLARGSHLAISGIGIDLGNSLFENGTIAVNGSASNLHTDGGNAVRITGSGILDSFSAVATFTPDNLTLVTPAWADGVVFDITLGQNTLNTTGTNGFTDLSAGGLTVFVSGLKNGLAVGDTIDVITFTGYESVALSHFQIESDLAGFGGTLKGYQNANFDFVLGVEITAVPEPGTIGLIALGGLVLSCALRRSRTSRSV